MEPHSSKPQWLAIRPPTGNVFFGSLGEYLLGRDKRGFEAPGVSLEDLLAGDRPEVAGRTHVRLNDYVDQIVRLGPPGLRS